MVQCSEGVWKGTLDNTIYPVTCERPENSELRTWLYAVQWMGENHPATGSTANEEST